MGAGYQQHSTMVCTKDLNTEFFTICCRNGVEYISTIEHIKYPFFGTQWHPEKPPYEFSLDAIPHSRDAVHVSQHLADIFVDYARHSDHKPESKEEELAMLIYNFDAYFTARDIVMEPSYDGPDITYFFDPEQGQNIKQPYHLGVTS